MKPTPQEYATEDARTQDSERVVISGMSGLYPQSNHVKELEEILYNKKNPVTSEDCRWKYEHPELSNYGGKVNNLDRFDAQFFKVYHRMSNNMDSMGRKLLEQTFQAIYDAGVSPEHLNGKKVGVYIGCTFSDTEKAALYGDKAGSGLGIAGCSRTMFANRISYWLNAKGPSMAMDDSCCSSIAALEQAYHSITRGECEAAIVGGANLCLNPKTSIQYSRIPTLSKDGKTKSFDKNADGCAKSDAINVLFIQKAKYAKRIYAQIVHIKSEFNHLLKGEIGQYGFYRNPALVADFLEQFYKQARISPNAVEYVEAFGSAIPEADKSELQAIETVFCKERVDPLLVGSVMSNIGYGDAASGISAITKVLLGYQRGEIAANLHYSTPRDDIAAVREGKIQIVGDHTSFGRTYTAVNGMSVTGINAHVLLEGNYKRKDLHRYKSSIPYLVTISGRQSSAVKHILEDLESRPLDPEQLALFHNIHQTRISGHLGRGFTIIDSDGDESVCLAQNIDYFDDAKRPLWFVYSGMGSQWVGMGEKLLRIPIFSAAIEKCRKILEPKGIDIVHIITSSDNTIFDNILHSFVGIAAVQIGLTDILLALGLVPDKIIGHSVGELGCAYADGCFTAEEMILAAYSRGLVSVQTPFIKGSMAAVGIGYEQVSKLLPPEIEVACHNSLESSTISGPVEAMHEFVAKLTADDIFAREVPCANIAFHSRYIAEAGPTLLKYLNEVIKTPKPRSERWVSTSVPQDKWDEPLAKFSSAEYHTNNLLSPVLFEETSQLIPANAVLVEIAPHGLLQAILKRSLPESCTHIPLTRRGHEDNAVMVLEAIGKLFIKGFNPKVEALYPKIEFPVSTGTPMMSHLIKWAHDEQWRLPLYRTALRLKAAVCNFAISIHDNEYHIFKGHVIRGKNLYPFSAALVAAWDTLAMTLNVPKKQLSVEFRDVHLYAQPPIHDNRQLMLSVELHRGNGRFEILEESCKVASGFIHTDPKETEKSFSLPFETNGQMNLTADDVYRLLEERDYSYQGEFRSINKANQSLTEAQVIWKDNWVTFLDGFLQLTALKEAHNSVSQPYQIRRLCIDVEKHKKEEIVVVDEKVVKVANVFETQDMARCGGVLLQNIKFRKLPKLEESGVVLKTLKFVPRFLAKNDIATALQIYIQAVAENLNQDIINVLCLLDTREEMIFFNNVKNIFDDIPGVTVNYEHMRREKMLISQDYFLSKADILLVQNLGEDDDLSQILYQVLRRDAFIIDSEEITESQVRPSSLYRVVSSQQVNKSKLDLLKWRPTQNSAPTTVVTVRNNTDLSLLTTSLHNIQQKHKLVILSSYPAIPGLKDLVKQWRKESSHNQTYLVMISEKDNLEQLPEMDLVYNVLYDCVWGGEYYTPCQEQKVVVERDVSLRTNKIGDLEALYWCEAPTPTGSGVPVTVHYAAINDTDVKRANGVYPLNDNAKAEETGFCMDFSGVTDCGKRVMGILPNGAASGRVNARPEMLWPVPDHWSLEDAATVPSAYAHAFYCFAIKLKLTNGLRVLVHGGTGALGQATISIALAHGCDVYTTVSEIKKKRFLMKLFPDLKEDHIGNSCDSSFGEMVLNGTNGKGCDVVISCLNGEQKNICFKSCADTGATLDIVQIPSREDFSLGMSHLTRERSYISVDFTSVFCREKIDEIQKLQLFISEGIAQGYVRPLSRLVYPSHDVSKAFRIVAGSRHRGRVLLKLHDSVLTAQPRLYCSPTSCQLILCDEELLGVQLADRLISRGAANLHIHCDNPSAYMRHKIQSWKNNNVIAQISSEDLTKNMHIVNLLNECYSLGPVEGIYVIATEVSDNNSNVKNSVVVNLDFAARKICPSLRYFVVITEGCGIGQKTCFSRVQNKLPATLVNLLGFRDANSRHTCHNAVNATELAIRSSQSNVLAYPKITGKSSLLDHVAKLAELNIDDNTPLTATLIDLGLELANVPHIGSFLRDTYNLALFESDIPKLTVEKIRELDSKVNEYNFEPVRGINSLLSYIDPDEMLATSEMVFMSTCSYAVNDGQFDVSQTYMCLIPGMEGHHSKFNVLCKRLKLPALVLQPGLDHPSETPRETAERYIKIFTEKTVLKENFYLLGYETGVMVALELASIMEEHGVTGTVYCIGGTPDEIKAAVEEQLSEYTTEDALQNAIIRHVFALIVGNSDGLDKVLQNAAGWQEKIKTCTRILLGQVPHSAQYVTALMDSAYMRICQVRLYKSHLKPLRSKIVWLRTSEISDVIPMQQMQQYSQQPVIVHELAVSLAHGTQHLQCPTIINRYLDPELLKAFDVNNLCETYTMNDSSTLAIVEE